ncbi:MAG: nucleotidyltransferase family protein [Alphaproteobacteria bacterium]|nr:nucleotidyltransferase family protein [Alphaproteobacteria bacterium]
MLKSAMILAAGKGKRLRPITDKTPKPLVNVGGMTLLDRILDHVEQAGICHVVVNAFHLGKKIAAHLEKREQPPVKVLFEKELLDTGGGVRNALGEMGKKPFFVINGDVLWFDGPQATLDRLAGVWNGSAMDALLLMQPVVRAEGYGGRGDFCMDPLGLLTRRGEGEMAPYVFAGVQVLHPRLFSSTPEGPFSLNLLYDRAQEAGRLYGVSHGGAWFHIGTPETLEKTRKLLENGRNNFYRP